jgi:uncharacterized protein (TIGR00290 family)
VDTAIAAELDLTLPPIRKPRVLVSWSSGKDSAWMLHTLRKAGEAEVVALLTTVNAAFDRVAMHAVRRCLLEAQAEALGLPLVIVPLPWPCSNAEYEAAIEKGLNEARERFQITGVAFGDLFLEDIRRYREEKMAEHTDLAPYFPIWQIPTDQLAHDMVTSGLKATITCVDPRKLDASFAGRAFDETFLADLPAGVDPCGENGEFHTFAWDGPMFRHPVHVQVGEVVEREGFVFADLLPA